MSSRWPRLIAIAGMVAILPLAIWLFLIGSLAAAGVFENLEPEEYTRGERIAAAAAETIALYAGVDARRQAGA
jgi:hypothetical protein